MEVETKVLAVTDMVEADVSAVIGVMMITEIQNAVIDLVWVTPQLLAYPSVVTLETYRFYHNTNLAEQEYRADHLRMPAMNALHPAPNCGSPDCRDPSALLILCSCRSQDSDRSKVNFGRPVTPAIVASIKPGQISHMPYRNNVPRHGTRGSLGCNQALNSCRPRTLVASRELVGKAGGELAGATGRCCSDPLPVLVSGYRVSLWVI
ncbi:hypothetical protein RRG08_031205 [Elysia crispata]|uniref:Uncharacterized protein n=1 Tax=Elysia crispata TaxID=231223 RepID=A0AAE0XMM7_9GAST|nr:hypothetical protein RRG08_031205 [Elysia crispata]